MMKKFDEDFQSDLKSKKSAYGVLIKHLISSLPMAERSAIEHGQVEMYGLKSGGPGAELKRDVFLMNVVRDGKATAYEVNPLLGSITKRDDYQGVFTGTSVIGKKTLARGTEANEFTVWNRPNIQQTKYRPKVDQQHKQPTNEPFHSNRSTRGCGKRREWKTVRPMCRDGCVCG